MRMIDRSDTQATIHLSPVRSHRPLSTGLPGTDAPVVPWGVQSIKAPAAWRKSTGKRVKIAIIDTGVDFNHPDLADAIGGGINLIHRHMLPLDDNGHGTHITGTIAASAKQSGIMGVAPRATIYAVKAFDHNGSSYVSDIVEGIEWCIKYRMDIINMSFGMKVRSAPLEAAIKQAYHAGIVIVASSGNEGKRGSVDYPARLPQTIAVGATNRAGKIAAFTNRGPQIDIYAPGERIVSTWLNGKYNELSGTSMATSHVTGTIALLLSIHPHLTPWQIKRILQKHASPLSHPGSRSGFLGQVNAYRTVCAMANRKRRNA